MGIAAALVAGFGSIPMCFDLHTVLWFNEQYVTMDVEDAKNLETSAGGRLVELELDGAAARQASFFLLCLQYSLDQMKNIGMKTYTERVKDKRGAKLVEKFPQYNGIVVAEFGRRSQGLRLDFRRWTRGSPSDLPAAFKLALTPHGNNYVQPRWPQNSMTWTSSGGSHGPSSARAWP